ncbi:MAG TPA: hypothetical protein VK559_12240 [Ferruginibacter sp.]|nr:hypothetical protein [Ferruginibacter sp.]
MKQQKKIHNETKGPAKSAPSQKPPVNYKIGVSLLLTFVSVLIVFVFFNMGNNSIWFNDRIVKYWDDYNDQSTDDMSIEHRRIYTDNMNYIMSEGIAKSIPPKFRDSALILMPSQKYFRDRRINFHVPLPVVFYYYTGIKTIWANSKDAPKANMCFRIDNKGKAVLEKITDTTRLRAFIIQFNTDTYQL